MKNFLLPRLRDIFFLAILIAALGLGPRMLSLDSDLGRHLTIGGFTLDSRQIPTRDLFSHTRADAPRPAYEWLTQVIFASANRIAGLDGVVLFSGLVIASAFFIVYTDTARRSRLPLAALGFSILAAAASSLHWLPRPHVVTFLLLAIWLGRLERVRRGETVPLWHFPILMLVWVNAHGGFIFGMLAWFAYFAGWVWERVRKQSDAQIGKKLIWVGGLSLTVTFVTPSLWGNWQAILNNNSFYILNRTLETMPPDFKQIGAWPFAILFLLSILILLATRKTFPTTHFFLLGGFAVLGLTMARNIPLFAIAVAPILAERTRELLEKSKRWLTVEANIAALESPLRGAVWPILFGLGLALLIGGRYQVQKEALSRFDARVFPVAATDWLVKHPQPGNMFNEFNWGGYLLVRLWPEKKVFLDSQTDFYGEALVREYEQAILAEDGWEKTLAKYEVDWAILPVSSPLAGALEQSGWEVLYQDDVASVLARK